MAIPQKLNKPGLAPAARPVDQFMAPEVRARSAGVEFMQLANALARISPEVQEIATRRFEHQVKMDAIAAQGDAPRFENMKAFNAAVKAGKLHKSDSPWYMAEMRRLVGENEAHGIAQQAYQDYLNDPQVSRSNSPQEVDDFLKAKMQPLADRLASSNDVWGAAGAMPALDRARQKIVAQHVEKRRVEKPKEMADAAENNIANDLDAWDASIPARLASGDADAQATVQNIRFSLQQRLNELGQVMPWADANQIVSKSVANMALLKRDPDLAREVLNGLVTQGGAKLSETADNRAMLDALPRQITDLVNGDMQREDQTRRLTEQREANAFHTMLKSKAAAEGKRPWDIRPSWDDLRIAAPDAVRRAEAKAIAYAVQKDMLDGVADLTPEQHRLKVAASMTGAAEMDSTEALLIVAGLQNAEDWQKFAYYQNNNDDRITTTPELTDELLKAEEDGTLTPDRVLAAHRSKTISGRDAKEWLHRAHAAQNGDRMGRRDGNTVSDYDLLAQQIDAKYATSGTDLSDTPEFKAKLAAAKIRFRTDLEELRSSEAWQKASPIERNRLRKELRDSVATANGGFTEQEMLELAKKPKPVPAPKPTGEIATTKAMQKADPIVDGVDENKVTSLRKLLKAPTGTPLISELVANRPDPIGDGISSGQVLLSRVRDTRTKYEFAAPKPENIKHGEKKIGGSRLAYGLMEREAQQHAAAMKQLQGLKPVAEESKGKLLKLLGDFESTGEATFEQQQEARKHAARWMSYLELRRDLGYTPEEVKAMEEGAWRVVPMFANEVDLQTRGPEAMRTLGLKPFQVEAFRDAQMKLIADARRR